MLDEGGDVAGEAHDGDIDADPGDDESAGGEGGPSDVADEAGHSQKELKIRLRVWFPGLRAHFEKYTVGRRRNGKFQGEEFQGVT